MSSTSPAAAQALNCVPKARACDEHCGAKWMDKNLRTDQVQVVGTAQSINSGPTRR